MALDPGPYRLRVEAIVVTDIGKAVIGSSTEAQVTVVPLTGVRAGAR